MSASKAFVASIFGWDVVNRDFHGYEHEVVLRAGGEIISYVGATRRTIDYGGQELQVCGIGFVCTSGRFLKMGLASALVRTAHLDAWRQRGEPFALLNCGIPTLYERIGYRHPPNLPGGWWVCEIVGVPWEDDRQIDLRGSW